MNISIGSDHAGFEYKNILKKHFAQKYNFIDCGTNSLESCDYPDYAHAVAKNIENKISNFGILICGSANGVAITANKHKDIRAALCWKKEIAILARQHNDANIICLPARYINEKELIEIVEEFFNTNFEGGRHLNRVNKINIL